MGLFTKRSKAEMAWEHLAGLASSGTAKGALKVLASATAALVGLTAASAAISSARQQE